MARADGHGQRVTGREGVGEGCDDVCHGYQNAPLFALAAVSHRERNVTRPWIGNSIRVCVLASQDAGQMLTSVYALHLPVSPRVAEGRTAPVMPEETPKRPDFAEELSAEVARVLQDPAFIKAPVQSRLLAYLCEQTLDGTRALSQFSIAVDGLGRDESYDLTSDSYPRVQISRLRRNLADHYTRVAPDRGLAVHVDRGDYKLRLAPPEKAYPERLGRQSAQPETESSDPASSLPPAPVPEKTTIFARFARTAGVLAALTILAFGIFNLTGGERAQATASPAAPPQIAVEVVAPRAMLEAIGQPHLADQMRYDMESHVAGSFIARLAPPDAASRADFRLVLRAAPSLNGKGRFRLELFDRSGARNYVSTLVVPADAARLLATLDGELSQLLVPSGLIAQEELQGKRGIETDYLCYLQTESSRADVPRMMRTLDQCLTRYPESDYIAYWLGRKAYILYQVDVMRGLPIRREGDAWDLTTQAMNADPFNSYANALAAKIALSDGDCGAAEGYFMRMMERGGFYHALAAMVAAEASSCGPDFASQAGDWRARIDAIANGNRTFDPLTQLYVMLASLGLDDRVAAEKLAHAKPIDQPSEDIEMAREELIRALGNPAYARANEARIDKLVARFIWNPEARHAIFGTLRAAGDPAG